MLFFTAEAYAIKEPNQWVTSSISTSIHVRTYESNDILRFVKNFLKSKAKAAWCTYDNRFRLINKQKSSIPSYMQYPTDTNFHTSPLRTLYFNAPTYTRTQSNALLPLCNNSTNSVERILNSCPAFRNIRQDYVKSSLS